MNVFTVYKTVNLINHRYYQGVHETSNPNDSYLGSGIVLTRAVAKYGASNFSKEILFVYNTAEEAFSKEVELCAISKNDPLCYNLHPGGKGGFKFILDHHLMTPVPKEFLTGRKPGSKNLIVPVTIFPEPVCKYGCGLGARFLLGEKGTPCCSDHSGKCAGYKASKKSTKVKRIYKQELICFYGCDRSASYLLGVSEKPCCSKSFYDCPGHWNNRPSISLPEMRAKSEITMLKRYGVVNPSSDPELLAKRTATNVRLYGGASPTCDSTVNQKRIRTNKKRFGGNAPACSKEIRDKMNATRRKSKLLPSS
jgi:hypothetical protein